MVCYELMSLISCSSIPTSLPERKSQSQLSIQQQLRMVGIPTLTRSSRHRNSVCLLNGVTRRRCASNTIAFGTQRAATAVATTKFPRSSWLVGCRLRGIRKRFGDRYA